MRMRLAWCILVAAMVMAACTHPATDETAASLPAASPDADILACASELPVDRAADWLVRVGSPARQAAVSSDGTVVLVTDRSINASIEDYLAWQISPEAVDNILALLATPADPGSVLEVPGEEAASLILDVLNPCFQARGRGGPADAAALLAAVLDRDVRVTDPRPWQPDQLWLIVHPADRLGTPNDPTDPFAPWPLSGLIADHVVGQDTYRPLSDQSVAVGWVCLTGDDVTPVWNLQQPGTRNTWIRLEDAWERSAK